MGNHVTSARGEIANVTIEKRKHDFTQMPKHALIDLIPRVVLACQLTCTPIIVLFFVNIDGFKPSINLILTYL